MEKNQPKKYIAANWKMYMLPEEAKTYWQTWALKPKLSSALEVIFFPPAWCWTTAQAQNHQLATSQAKSWSWGAQNIAFEDWGAYTGENSPKAAQSLGAQWVLLGHSERRSLFAEDSGLIKKKWLKAQSLGLKVMLCIGETLTQRQNRSWPQVLTHQLQEVLLDSQGEPKTPLTIAYEPVWSIGTGVTPTPEDITATHKHIQSTLRELFPQATIPILYGGSVKPGNAREILKLPEVDGVLVGGASLKVEDFYSIAQAALT